MIIAISGKIESGKDTVGKIVQYLTSKNDNKLKIETYLKSQNSFITDGFEIKKFAGKLKQIVSILTGILVEDLEKQEVKDRVLGEEWNRFFFTRAKVKHFSIGKNGYTWENHNKFFTSYTDAEKEFISLSEKIQDHSPDWWKINKESITVRQLLQEVGTEAMRNIIHPNIWVNALFADYKTETEKLNFSILSQRDIKEGFNKYPNWIITDMRFPNELQAVKDRGGITIRVNRPKDMLEWGQIMPKEHESETSLDNAKFNYVIDNNGTIEELIGKVREILIKEKIIN